MDASTSRSRYIRRRFTADSYKPLQRHTVYPLRKNVADSRSVIIIIIIVIIYVAWKVLFVFYGTSAKRNRVLFRRKKYEFSYFSFGATKQDTTHSDRKILFYTTRSDRIIFQK